MTKIGLSFFSLILLITTITAQEITEGEFAHRMDLGEDWMKQGRFEEANEAFLFVIENKKVLSGNIAYLFGRNSYHLGKYKQSINWLNKYIQIKGTKRSLL